MMMDNEQRQDEPEGLIMFKGYVGLCLIGLGVFVAMWVFSNVYSMIRNPEEITSFQNLVSERLESTWTFDGERMKVVIPREFMAYFVPIVLLAIAVSVASILIAGGVKVLHGDFQAMTVKFRALRSGLERKMDDLRNTMREYKDKGP
jgi:hypothetical protein